MTIIESTVDYCYYTVAMIPLSFLNHILRAKLHVSLNSLTRKSWKETTLLVAHNNTMQVQCDMCSATCNNTTRKTSRIGNVGGEKTAARRAL